MMKGIASSILSLIQKKDESKRNIDDHNNHDEEKKIEKTKKLYIEILYTTMSFLRRTNLAPWICLAQVNINLEEFQLTKDTNVYFFLNEKDPGYKFGTVLSKNEIVKYGDEKIWGTYKIRYIESVGNDTINYEIKQDVPPKNIIAYEDISPAFSTYSDALGSPFHDTNSEEVEYNPNDTVNFPIDILEQEKEEDNEEKTSSDPFLSPPPQLALEDVVEITKYALNNVESWKDVKLIYDCVNIIISGIPPLYKKNKTPFGEKKDLLQKVVNEIFFHEIFFRIEHIPSFALQKQKTDKELEEELSKNILACFDKNQVPKFSEMVHILSYYVERDKWEEVVRYLSLMYRLKIMP